MTDLVVDLVRTGPWLWVSRFPLIRKIFEWLDDRLAARKWVGTMVEIDGQLRTVVAARGHTITLDRALNEPPDLSSFRVFR